MKQEQIGKTCPYCQYPLKADSEAVQCPSCKVPHHQECWEQNGGCTTFGCRETASQPIVRERLEVSFEGQPGREAVPSRGGGINKLLAIALVISLLVLVVVVFANINLRSDRAAAVDNESVVTTGESEVEEAPHSLALDDDLAILLGEEETEEEAQTFNAIAFTALDAEYYIDYKHGTIPIGDLPNGARVVDVSWEWEFRTGLGYVRLYGDETKPVTWIVVAKDHYEGLAPHATLLSKNLVGRFPFDDSTNRGSIGGNNNWGESGTGNSTRGLRPWLNSTGLHSGEGFYQAFSESFKRAVLTTTLTNKEWQYGSAYSTSDNVFIPSTTELGDKDHNWTYTIGDAYSYFAESGDAERVARIVGDGWYEFVERNFSEDFIEKWGIDCNNWFYWTRSPGSDGGGHVRGVLANGVFQGDNANAGGGHIGVRPALNLKSEILVSEISP